MRRKKRCPCCPKKVNPNPRLRERQKTCGDPVCKKKHKRAYLKGWKTKNKEICREYSKEWRQDNPDYWKDYRQNHPDYTERNRSQSKVRRSLSKLSLQKNLDILQLTEKQMELWNFARFVKEPRSLVPLLFAYGDTNHRAKEATYVT